VLLQLSSTKIYGCSYVGVVFIERAVGIFPLDFALKYKIRLLVSFNGHDGFFFPFYFEKISNKLRITNMVGDL
jgi:hypothetical protein